MKRQFDFEGSVYSKNKADFKKILKRHGLKWKGSMGDFIWIGKDEKVIAEFERDSERDVTISATLTWSGKKRTDFVKELEDWTKEVGGKKTTPRKKVTKSTKRVQEELDFWDKLNKPDVDRLKSEGRPESWIQKDLKEWKKKRLRKKSELMKKYG